MITENELKKIISQSVKGIHVDDLIGTKHFEEMGMDSLDQSTFLLALEEQYKIRIPDEDVDNCYSIESTLDYIASKA